MYNVLIVEDDPMARKLLEIFVSTSEQYHLVPSLDSAAMAELYCIPIIIMIFHKPSFGVS